MTTSNVGSGALSPSIILAPLAVVALAGCGLKDMAMPCQSDDALSEMIQNSGYYIDDPVRGFHAIESLALTIKDIEQVQRQADRTICSANFYVQGQKGYLAKTTMNVNFSTNTDFMLSEITSGVLLTAEPELAEQFNANPFSALLGSGVTALGLFGTMDSVDINKHTELSTYISNIEYSVDFSGNLVAWSWFTQDSPGFHAGKDWGEILKKENISLAGSLLGK